MRRVPLQPDSYPITGFSRSPRMAMDSMPWRSPGKDSEVTDPGAALVGYLRKLLGEGHKDLPELERMVADCMQWDGEATDEANNEGERRAAEDARRVSQAHDGTPAGRARAAAAARKVAADAALNRRFPGLHRIGGGY